MTFNNLEEKKEEIVYAEIFFFDACKFRSFHFSFKSEFKD